MRYGYVITFMLCLLNSQIAASNTIESEDLSQESQTLTADQQLMQQTEALLKKRGQFIDRIKKLESEMEDNLLQMREAEKADQPTEVFEEKLKKQKIALDALIDEMQTSIDELVKQQQAILKNQQSEVSR